MIDYPNPIYLCMTVHDGIPADLSDGVGKVYNLGHGQLGWPYLTYVKFWFIKNVFEKNGVLLDGVLGGYCRGLMVVRSTWRVLPTT
jgi:hypothetical protein